MKKKHLCLLFILGIFIFFVYWQNKGDYKPKYEDFPVQTNSTDLNQISQLVAKEFLDSYKKDNVHGSLKLRDYKIEKIDSVKGDLNKFRFWLTYSVKPAYVYLNEWAVTNGEPEGLWIKNRVQFVDVEKTDNGYIIKEMGTGV